MDILEAIRRGRDDMAAPISRTELELLDRGLPPELRRELFRSENSSLPAFLPGSPIPRAAFLDPDSYDPDVDPYYWND